MACRVGMTTNLADRERYWRSVHRNLTGWQVLSGPHYSREDAQAEEDRLAKQYGCIASGGGADPSDPYAKWYVYGFDY